MSRYRHLTILPILGLLLAACSDKGGVVTEEGKIPPTPDTYRVKFETSKGDFVLEVTKAWAPQGAERFWELVHRKFYDDCRFFRMLPGFMVQWGINGSPQVQSKWRDFSIPDDPVKGTNAKGTISYAKSGPNTRTSQVFINLVDNARLDPDGFAPFGKVLSGMEVVEGLYAGYGEGYPGGNGPRQNMLQTQGNEYLQREFPRLDYIKTARVQ
ncbi:MAG: peptidylprolyl isomerase [Bryobacteraceae bacterium]